MTTNTAIANEIKDLFMNPEFQEKFVGCTTAEEAAAILYEAGYVVDAKELDAAIADFNARSENGELTDDELEAVSGGFFISGPVFLGIAILYTMFCGSVCKATLSRRR